MSTYPSHCIICGALATNTQPEWMSKFRAVYTELQQWDAARISRIGKIRQGNRATIPFDGPLSVDVTGLITGNSSIEIELMRLCFSEKRLTNTSFTSFPLWGFPCHSSCWDILSVAASQSGLHLDAQAIFDLCRSQPGFLKTLDWGHNYGGPDASKIPVKMVLPGEEPRFRIHKDVLEHVSMHNPFEIFGLCDLVSESGPGLTANVEEDHSLIAEAPENGDPLGALPFDIRVDILIRLESKDVVSLRKVSRAFASTVLPAKFWKSRFWPGREFSHVFELGKSHIKFRPWKDLFHRVKAMKGIPSMKNRKRIWYLASNFCDLLDLRLAAPICCGSPSHGSFEPNGLSDQLTWDSVIDNSRPADDHFTSGSRALYNRLTPVSTTHAAIFVSTVRITTGNYISGIRFVSQDEQTTSIGYIHGGDETPVVWEQSQRGMPIKGFQAAFDGRGIRGLSAVALSGAVSGWIGDHENTSQKRLTVGSWEKNGLTELKYIKAGFDALKCVSLSVSGGKKEKGCEKADTSPPLRDSAIWYPEIPGPNLSIIGKKDLQHSNSGKQPPLSVVLFGGEHGQYLPYLSEINVWTYTEADVFGSRPPGIWGIQFVYDREIDGSRELALGRTPGGSWLYDVHCIRIYSDDGERFTRIEPQLDSSNNVLSCKFETNRRRAREIPPPRPTNSFNHEDIPDPFWQTQSPIVGVFAGLVIEEVIQDLGIICINPSTSSSLDG